MFEQQLQPLLGDTQIVRVQDFSSYFQSEFPAGSRAALFFAEGDRGAVPEHLFSALAPFSPLCAAVGQGCASGLFSLPDEVRAVVALGNRAFLAARFFATLRGVACYAVPTSPSAEECFSPSAPPPFSGYPLRAPDKILLCGNFLHVDCGAALAHTALAAVCAEELRTDALFSERKPLSAPPLSPSRTGKTGKRSFAHPPCLSCRARSLSPAWVWPIICARTCRKGGRRRIFRC